METFGASECGGLVVERNKLGMLSYMGLSELYLYDYMGLSEFAFSLLERSLLHRKDAPFGSLVCWKATPKRASVARIFLEGEACWFV